MGEDIERWLAAADWTVLSAHGDRPVYQVVRDGLRCVAKTSDAREPAAIARLGAAGVPVQKVIAYDDPFLVMEWIDGTPLSSSSPVPVQWEVGHLLRRIHSLGGEPPYKGNASFAFWVRGWLQHNVHWWQPGPAAEGQIWELFESLEGLLGTRGKDLMLMDGRPEHILVLQDKVAGVIDVGEICPGDGMMDLAVLAVSDPALLHGVLAGYGAHEARLIPLYLLMRRLSHAEWLLDHGRPADASKILRLVSAAPPFAAPA